MNRRFFGRKFAGVAAVMGLGAVVTARPESHASAYEWWPRGAKKMLLRTEFRELHKTSPDHPDMASLTKTFLYPDSTEKTTSCITDSQSAWSMMDDFGTYYY